MKVGRYAYILHALIWIILLVIPYVSTDQVFETLSADVIAKHRMLSLILSSVLIAIFYFNYLVLIPRYLLHKRYWAYAAFLLLAVVGVFFLSGSLFFYTDGDMHFFTKDEPIIEKIFPVIVMNALLLWLLSIVSSILWTGYTRLKQIESEKLTAQIASLKSQINPHFLFNTLNNIYASAIDTSPATADMVDKLSEMMRYTMKDTQQDFVSLEDEVNYLNNYIDLQKLRLDKSVKIIWHPLQSIPALRIAPLLIIPFIENAFKHGVNPEQKSAISFELKMNRAELQVTVVNSKVSVQKHIYEKSGLGIANTKRRLQLIYPDRHLLVIQETEKEFFVSLHINLQ